MFILVIFDFGVFRALFKEEEERVENEIAKFSMSTDQYTQVYLKYRDYSLDSILSQILNNEGYTFYAKFDENEEKVISLIAKDSKDNTIYEEKINVFFFTNNFEPTKN